MPPWDLATHIMGGINMTTMIIIMIIAIVVLTRLIVEEHDRVMTLMIRMIHHPQMALINHHARVERKPPTRTHPLRQRIGINEDTDPTVVIGLGLIDMIIVIDDMPVIIVMAVPQTRPV